jgi:Domain of unknown function (DUF4145)
MQRTGLRAAADAGRLPKAAGTSMTDPTRHALDDYFADSPPPVFTLNAHAQFTPIDINLAYLAQSGWNQTVDRLRFHVQNQVPPASGHPLADALRTMQPHLLVRRLDEEEDRFISIQIAIDGNVAVMSNDREFAMEVLGHLLLEFPPSFHTIDELELAESWTKDPQAVALFLGMLSGARGWDPSHNIPANIRESLNEAHRSLKIANYRSAVVMSRRTLEAVLKFGFRRLLGREPVDRRGRGLMLNDMIAQFRNEAARPIPDHLLHIADSIRLLGNVPGAHAADIPNYQFTRSDAEYALYGVSHFLYEYFNKIDREVTEYYSLTIDLSDHEAEDENAK